MNSKNTRGKQKESAQTDSFCFLLLGVIYVFCDRLFCHRFDDLFTSFFCIDACLNFCRIFSGNWVFAGTYRDLTTDDNVFLQTVELIDAAIDCSINKNTSCILEGCS